MYAAFYAFLFLEYPKLASCVFFVVVVNLNIKYFVVLKEPLILPVG